jgi:hypothetical protein
MAVFRSVLRKGRIKSRRKDGAELTDNHDFQGIKRKNPGFSRVSEDRVVARLLLLIKT